MENESKKEDLDKFFDEPKKIFLRIDSNPFQKEWNEFNKLELFNVANIALRPYGWVLCKVVERGDYTEEKILNVYPMKLGEKT
jgi:hypothetical protein